MAPAADICGIQPRCDGAEHGADLGILVAAQAALFGDERIDVTDGTFAVEVAGLAVRQCSDHLGIRCRLLDLIVEIGDDLAAVDLDAQPGIAAGALGRAQEGFGLFALPAVAHHLVHGAEGDPRHGVGGTHGVAPDRLVQDPADCQPDTAKNQHPDRQ